MVSRHGGQGTSVRKAHLTTTASDDSLSWAERRHTMTLTTHTALESFDP